MNNVRMRRNHADEEHGAPSPTRKHRIERAGGEKIAYRVALLQSPDAKPRHFGGTDSSTSEAPTPQLPPIPIP